MSELLSNDQIAELVAAAKEGEIPRPSTQRKRSRKVRTIDFSLPTRFTLEQKRRLERAHKSFARAMGPILSAELGTGVECEVIDLSQVTYQAAVQELPPAAISGIARISRLETRVLLALDGLAAATMVDRMLGGSGRSTMFSPEPTQIEVGLLRRLFSTFIGQLSRDWEDVAGVQLELDELELKLSNNEIAPRSEPCIAVTLELRVDDRAPTLVVVIPYQAIDPIAHRLEAPHEPGTAGESGDPERVLARLRSVLVEARAEVAHTELTMEEILALQPGDVVPLGVPQATGVTLAVGDAEVLRCVPGKNGNRRALEIVERCEVET